MYCKNCGTKINDNASFCKVCGNRVKAAPLRQNNMEQQMKYCIRCGKQIKVGVRFCNYCGYSFDTKKDPSSNMAAGKAIAANAASRIGVAATAAIRGNLSKEITPAR